MITASDQFIKKYPSAHAGILIIRDVQNPSSHAQLEETKRQIEMDLRNRFSALDAQALSTIPLLCAYTAYYKQFNKTYHVLGQLVSIIHKGKSIPTVSALVEAMFMAELKNGLLTAGHDLDQIHMPISINIAEGDEHYVVMRGQDQVLKSGDMYISDEESILSSVLYGPDQRTQITPATKNVLFTVYAPEGVDPEAVKSHLTDICNLVLIVSPQAKMDQLQVI